METMQPVHSPHGVLNMKHHINNKNLDLDGFHLRVLKKLRYEIAELLAKVYTAVVMKRHHA